MITTIIVHTITTFYFSIFEYLPVMDVLLKVEEDVVFCSLFGDVSTSIYVLELVGNVSSTISLAF